SLLDALPQHRVQLAQLIRKEFPLMFLPGNNKQEESLEIPARFYAQILKTYTTSPPQLRTIAVGRQVLEQMLQQFDPHQLGLVIVIVRCTMPPPGLPVRSLRQSLGRGTGPWNILNDNHLRFYGAESQVGNTIITGHAQIFQNRQERRRLFPTHDPIFEQS